MSESDAPAILSEEALVRLNADGWEIPAEVYESHEALRKQVEALQRRLAPDQGHGYDNEVERQRAVIEELQALAEDYRSRGMQVVTERDGMLAELHRVDEALVARSIEALSQTALIAVISPFVQHRPFCVKSGGRCTCGLITALTEVNETLENLHAE